MTTPEVIHTLETLCQTVHATYHHQVDSRTCLLEVCTRARQAINALRVLGDDRSAEEVGG